MKRFLTLLAVLALVAAACGDGDDTAAETTAAPTAPSTTVSPLAPATTSASGETTAPATTALPEGPTADCELGEVDGDLNLYNWTEYLPYGQEAIDFNVTDLAAKFEQEYGVTIVHTNYTNNEEMVAQVNAGAAPYDLVVPSDYMVDIMIEEGLLLPLNKDAIPNLANIDTSIFSNLPWDPEGAYSVPYQWGTTGIGFRYDALPEDFDPSWGLFFEPDSPVAGQFSLLDDPREVLAAGLKYLGYSLNTTSQAELDEAVELIRSVKDNIKLFDTNTFEENLTAGEVDAAHGWNGDFIGEYDLISTDDYDAYEDYGYFIPKEGGVAWVDNMAIPITAEHPCTALAFINFILEAENGAELTNYTYYASPNAAAWEFIRRGIRRDKSIYPSDKTMANLEFIADTGDFELEYQAAFEAIKN